MMDCELCAATGGTLLWQGEQCRVVLVEDADYPGFCRVIWNRHVQEMTDLHDKERDAYMRVVFSVEGAVRAALQPDKINLASFGNMTPHLHWHVIPRYRTDKNFPQPVWGSAQRSGTSQVPQDWRARLNENLLVRLTD